ncbi:MAG: hypothetical protein KatS3mg057_1581 [Herpetosiphonaceae bacterium]|nr:MAG: hypothetical protein KatS3mg057_1581 [Herpetosiphonaceae bacterium]
MKQRRQFIRASEVGDYVYCRRSWWLRRVAGWEPGRPERLSQGRSLHRRHGQMTGASGALLLIGLVFVVTALLLLLQ